MSLSSTSSPPGRRAMRAAVAAVVAVALLAPVGVLFAQVWSGTGDTLSFNESERRGVAYLGPLTELLSVATDAQSAAVRGDPVDAAAVRSAIAAVDEVDRRLGGELRTTERWTAIRLTIEDRASRSWPVPSVAYNQYSDLVTSLIELNRKVGDTSNLILDPELDTYYVMNATLLRIPEILVDSGRYADLTVLAARGRKDDATVAQLTTARNRVATDATDLGDGLVKAFAETRSDTLGQGLTRALDDFRTAVDAVAPSNSLLAPPPERTLGTLAADQDELQRTGLALQRASLAELDSLLRGRQAAAERTRLLSLIAVALAVLVVAGVAVGLKPAWSGSTGRPDDSDRADGADRAGRAGRAAAGGGGEPRGGELVGVGGHERRGGVRAAR
jgi:hypothetical protein